MLQRKITDNQFQQLSYRSARFSQTFNFKVVGIRDKPSSARPFSKSILELKFS